jgi:regulator of sigma E protease
MTAEKLIVYLLMLSVLVVLHELGHFIVARRNGVYVTDFAVGMGPTLLKWTSPRSGTHYRLNAFPVGGYCQMKGEDGKSTEAEQQREFRTAETADHDSFQAKTPLQRLGIVVAGPVANFIVALVLLFAAGLAFGVPSNKPTTTVGALVPGDPADRAGLRPGDRITAVDGVPMNDGDHLIALIHRSAGKLLQLDYVRNGATVHVAVTPRLESSPGGGPKEGHLGFAPQFPPPQRMGVAAAASGAWDTFSNVVVGSVSTLAGLVTHPSQVAGQLQGPIGMARASAQIQDLGPLPFVQLAALISISLGIFNLLPIPALDGGRGVFILVEMLRGRPVDPEKEALVHVGGFAVLIALMLVVSYHDIANAIAHKSVF